MAKKKKEAPVPDKKKRYCFTCDGTGQICEQCGEAEGVCICDDEEDSNGSDLSECEECNGTGIAYLDLDKANRDKVDANKKDKK